MSTIPKQRTILALGIAAALSIASGPSAPARAGSPNSPGDDPAALLDGVRAIPPAGTVGQIAVWGDDAFAVIVGKEDRTSAPIVGAGKLGRGRVMAWAHDYASTKLAARLSTGTLILNSCRWASGSPARPGEKIRAALLGSDLAPFLRERGIEPLTIDRSQGLSPQLKNADVLLCSRADLSDADVGAITAFVKSGGGFLCFACPWGWAQVHHRPVSEIPFNRVLAGAGIAFTDGYTEPTEDGAFRVDGLPGNEYHAARALDMLVEGSRSQDAKDRARLRQAGATVTRAVGALPGDDRVLRPRLAALLRARSGELAPGPDAPLKEAQSLERVLLAAQLSEIEALPPASITPHPAAAKFPGGAPAGAPEVTRGLSIDTGIPRWHSTGLYAPPGGIVRISVVGDTDRALKAGLRVRIGCHTDELWHLPQWKRVPRISRDWAIDARSLQVASAFGGLVFIEVPDHAGAGTVRLEVSGVLEAPLFVLGSTTNKEWSEIRDRPAPWAELACDRVILTIPSAVARTIDDPTAIMEHWTRVLDADADLAGIPRQRPSPERYVADVQISAGYMHSGYPIMTHLDAASFMTDAKGLVESGWGPYHEMGHNHQDDLWTFDGTGEVTCNIFTLYVLENVCGMADASQMKVTGNDAARARAKYFAEGRKFETWKSEPFLALQMYAQVRLAFGWDVYKAVFREYRGLAPGERPNNDEQKRDQWMVRLSRATGRNLGPFFEAWGVPTSAGARDSVKDLAGWMPEEMRSE